MNNRGFRVDRLDGVRHFEFQGPETGFGGDGVSLVAQSKSTGFARSARHQLDGSVEVYEEKRPKGQLWRPGDGGYLTLLCCAGRFGLG